MSHIVASLTSVVAYALLMRVALLTGVILVSLPWLVRLPGVRALLLGLFDVTPGSTIAVTLAAASVSGIVVDDCRVIYLHSYARGMGGLEGAPEAVPWALWFSLSLLLGLPVIAFMIKFSNQQNPGDFGKRWLLAIATILCLASAQQGSVTVFGWVVDRFGLSDYKDFPDFLNGYSPMKDHVSAAAGFSVSLLVYLMLGFYGRSRLGKKATVPALCSLLMLMMLACSSLSAMSFFLDLWHVPLLLVLTCAALITAQSKNSDHYYALVGRPQNAGPAPTALETIQATKASANGRIILVAANGGGIQAAAWTAQALEGLGEDSGNFAPSLRLISSVSGGSLGSVCYTYKQAQPEARDAFLAASRSSLDEVAWGLSWPDVMNSILPWFTRGWTGRGRALELAWVANSATEASPNSQLDQPLSNWNDRVASGDLPAVIMNATLVESGQRLLLGTTRFLKSENGCARVDASEMHGKQNDVAAVTAARLSASFPYVTPASRSTASGPQPHVVDGGYYDNYGMSTLVEWLDEALSADGPSSVNSGVNGGVSSVLVVQIHGAPVANGNAPPSGKVSERGWFYQIVAPVLTLNNVRGAGQIAHNDLELGQLQKRWFGKLPIHSVTLEFPDDTGPLSWHLTRQQRECVLERWNGDSGVAKGRQQVRDFLSGSDRIGCRCPTCNQNSPLEQVAAKSC